MTTPDEIWQSLQWGHNILYTLKARLEELASVGQRLTKVDKIGPEQDSLLSVLGIWAVGFALQKIMYLLQQAAFHLKQIYSAACDLWICRYDCCQL